MANIKKVATDMCMMDYYVQDEEEIRRNYGNEAVKNNIVWNFKQRLGEDVEILSISVVYIVSWEQMDIGDGRTITIPRKVMYLCTYAYDEEPNWNEE
jgi:hypothetical protein